MGCPGRPCFLIVAKNGIFQFSDMTFVFSCYFLKNHFRDFRDNSVVENASELSIRKNHLFQPAL